MADRSGAIAGAIPSTLLAEKELESIVGNLENTGSLQEDEVFKMAQSAVGWKVKKNVDKILYAIPKQL